MQTILWIIYSVALFVLYHKLFDVVYFDFSQGIVREIIFVVLGGAFLAGLTLAYWWVALIILVLIIFIVKNKG